MWDSFGEKENDAAAQEPVSLFYDTNSRDSGFDDFEPSSFDSEVYSSIEDDFLENFSEINFENCHNTPTDFENLLIKPLIKSPLSTIDSNKTPVLSRRIIKRPSALKQETIVKKTRIVFEEDIQVPEGKQCVSSTEESIMCAVQKSSEDSDLIGDFSKNCCLPLANSRHSDLKAISASTLVRLIRGEFRNVVGSFKIIDCRYPYEYQGGHIMGAENIYTKEACSELLNQNTQIDQNKRTNVLIFHCEFSSERGPNLYRHLRQEDRIRNESFYPFLTFPEIYLLEGGYKKFYEQFSELCVPVGYKPMLLAGHEEELKYFRQMSKTWNSDMRATKKVQKSRNIKRLLM